MLKQWVWGTDSLLTDSNHLQMTRLHLLLEHRRIGHDLLQVLDIVSSLDHLSTERGVSRRSTQEERYAYPVVPGARLKLSKVTPIRVHFDSLEGS